ncbi:MAG: RimK family alpha-L-glutamate ligase [Clostridiales bacterium]|nr:RimK family alpha-L-glutamate ligase [Clostridiales bacterium]
MRLFNSARAVAICDDKALTHAALSGRLPMPRTVPVPQTYKYVGYGEMAFLKRAAEYLGLPLIIKECRGSFGKQVYLADTEEQAAEIIRAHEATPMIMQQAVRESFGRDVRIYVVGGEVMGAMQRSNGRDFRANIANGGSGEAYVPSDEEKHLALEAVRLLGLDFGGVDILHSQEGPLLCEVNSNAHFAGMEKSTGADISGAIMRYIRSELEK